MFVLSVVKNFRVIHDYQGMTDRIRLLFHKEKEPYLRLASILGFLPHDLNIYKVALMHRSLGTKESDKLLINNHRVNNERLEFLGDAILSSIVADILYHKYPNKQEGFLTTLRSKLVRRDTLNKLAAQIGLDKLVLFSGRVSSAHNSYMNGNAFEAFIGAIYLDRGYDFCMRFIRDVVLGKYINLEDVAKTEENYKSKLIEWCQKYQMDIQFDLVSQQILRDRTTPTFVSKVTIEGVYCGRGEGFSKKESHQNAARQAYTHIRRDPSFVNSLIDARSERNKQSLKEDECSN